MDNLDKISILIIAVLVTVLIVFGLDYKSEDDISAKLILTKAVYANGLNEIPVEKIRILKDLIANDNINKAEAWVGALLGEYPYDGAPHMMMGNIMLRKQDPVAAMYSYRKAVDLNPDYVDKKAELFQGRKIKNTVNEAKDIIDKALLKNNGDKDMKKAKKTVYYLMRRLAGSCG